MRDARSRLLAAALAVGVLAHMVGPATVRGVVTAGVGLIALAVAVAGLARLPRDTRGGWTLVVAGLLVLTTTQTAITIAGLGGTTPPRSMSMATHALAAIVLAAGVTRVAGPPRIRDLASSVDALIVAVAVSTAVGALIVRPTWGEVEGTALVPLLLLHPAAHLVLLVATIGLGMVAPWRWAVARLLISASLTLVVAAAAGLAGIVPGAPSPGALPGLALLGAPVLLALAVAHPSASELSRLPIPDRVPDAPWRVVVLATVLLLLPLTALAVADDGAGVAVALATAALVLLLIARLGLLVRELRASQARELAEEQERGHRRLEALVRHTSDALLVVGGDERVTYATPAATAVFGADPTGWSRQQLLEFVHPEDRDVTLRTLLESLRVDHGRPVRLQTRLHTPDHPERHLEVVAVNLVDDPDVAGTVLTLQDITDRVELERRLRHLAFHDPLTGLSNREVLQDRLVQALGRAARQRQPIAVLLCDLDDFKDVNDTHGHAVGDQMLVAIAQRLRGAARSTDTVARLGGDEFAILCEGIGGHRDALDIARRVLGATDEAIDIGGRSLRAGVSIGIAVDDGRRSGQELLRDADIALYEAKADGKQRWSIHRRRMTERAHARLQLASDLGRAVETGRIEVAFQPIVRLPDLRVTGVETLARWEHPDRGWIPPSEFIPLAEETGQIVGLGDIVLRESLKALRGWDREGQLDLRVGVNVSARQVRDPGLPGRVAGWLAEYRIDPARLVLELTESVMIDEADDAIEVMQRLRELGVRFAVDDFGTGYSSLAYLRRLPVDIVKTDRAFVRELGSDEASADVVRAVVEMARSLRLDVVAEGVESSRQLDALVAMGCGFAQGYLFSRPVSAEALLPRLRGGAPSDAHTGRRLRHARHEEPPTHGAAEPRAV